MTHVPLSELPEFARNVRAVLKLLPHTGRALVVHLVGELGAGKTTFVQTIAKDFGIEEKVMSPTYTLMRSYDIPGDRLSSGQRRRFSRLVHIDAYRLEKAAEWAQLRPEEFLGQDGTVVFIEWPERIAGAGPQPDMVLDFSSDEGDPGARNIKMHTEHH